jgi:hypothetical protein
MRNTSSETLLIGWVREHFGIEDEDEVRAVLADPSEMLALLDVARAAGQEGEPVAEFGVPSAA